MLNHQVKQLKHSSRIMLRASLAHNPAAHLLWRDE